MPHIVIPLTFIKSEDVRICKKEKKPTESNSLCLDLLISHFQELGIYIPGTLPFLVEQELVIAAISTNGWGKDSKQTKKKNFN